MKKSYDSKFKSRMASKKALCRGLTVVEIAGKHYVNFLQFQADSFGTPISDAE